MYYEEDNYDAQERMYDICPYPSHPTYDEYGGYNGYDDETIDIVFDGDPEATWNVD